MITDPTVFILGAGASAAYGFPTGRQLRDLICRQDPEADYFAQAGVESGLMRRFLDTLCHSGSTTVDFFLETFPVFRDVGKVAIAAVLLAAEESSRLFPPVAPAGSWYEALLRHLPTHKINDFERRHPPRSPLTVVTFNYDRSFECYLNTVRRTLLGSGPYAVREEHADADVPAPIEVIHVHGSLGQLRSVEAYGADWRSPSLLLEAASHIRVVGEQGTHEDQHFSRAHAAIRGAEGAYVMGFGYHLKSLERLGFLQGHGGPWDRIKASPGRIRFLTYGMPANRWDGVAEHLAAAGWQGLQTTTRPIEQFVASDAPFVG